jgi:general stress protein YciG
MTPERHAEISSKGGKRAHELGRAHRFTWAEACRAGRRGGETISQDREHMAQIGRNGGKIRGANAAKKAEARRAANDASPDTAEDSPID